MLITMLGYKGSGKDTTADIFVRYLESKGYMVKRHAFADPLKTFLSELFDLDKDYYFYNQDVKEVRCIVDVPERDYLLHFDEFSEQDYLESFYEKMEKFRIVDNGNKYFVSPRELMQVVGTDVFRTHDENYWLKRCPTTNKNEVLIVTDARFPNEVEFTIHNNGVVVKVQRDNQSTNTDTHESEKYIDKLHYDCKIHTTGTCLKELEEKALQTIKTILSDVEHE